MLHECDHQAGHANVPEPERSELHLYEFNSTVQLNPAILLGGPACV